MQVQDHYEPHSCFFNHCINNKFVASKLHYTRCVGCSIYFLSFELSLLVTHTASHFVGSAFSLLVTILVALVERGLFWFANLLSV